MIRAWIITQPKAGEEKGELCGQPRRKKLKKKEEEEEEELIAEINKLQ